MSSEEAKGNEVSEKPKKLLLSEGLIIAASPIMGYLLGFIYEAGFARVFKIPLHFITISLTTVFVATGSLLLVALLLFQLTDMIFMVLSSFQRNDGPIYRRLVRLFPAFLYSLANLLFTVGTHSGLWIAVIVVSIIFVFFEFGFPLITQRDKASYRDKLEAQDRLDAQVEGIISHIARYTGPQATPQPVSRANSWSLTLHPKW